MAINPVKLMQMKAAIAGVNRRHPNLQKFFQAVGREKMREGTILELKVQTPEGKNMVTNIRLTKEDEELILELLKNKDTQL